MSSTTPSTHYDKADELERGDGNIPVSLLRSSTSDVSLKPLTATLMLPEPSTTSTTPLRMLSNGSISSPEDEKPGADVPFVVELPTAPEKAHTASVEKDAVSIHESLRRRHLMTIKGAPAKVKTWLEFQYFMTTYREHRPFHLAMDIVFRAEVTVHLTSPSAMGSFVYLQVNSLSS